jgi:hypothetical protein
MPSTIRDLFSAYRLEPAGFARWGQPLHERQPGVYVVALTGDADDVTATLQECPLDPAAISELVRVCPRLLLDGRPTSATDVGERIASFWIADEVALYIGRTGQPLAKRVSQYYRTPIGAPRPHKGGWWIKTLRVLPELCVHWARTPDDIDAEDTMLRHFTAHVSAVARAALPGGPPMPFANLMDGDDRRKSHGISNATSADTTRTIKRSRTTPATARPTQSTPQVTAKRRLLPASTLSPTSGALTTQRVTATDRAAGRIRFPHGSKNLLPDDRADITVRVHGHELVCRWDPRYGPPERSGVLTVGRAFAAEHLLEDEVLHVAVHEGVVILS